MEESISIQKVNINANAQLEHLKIGLSYLGQMW